VPRNSKTTFILGAGASRPYGFPTAFELREILVQKHPRRVEEILTSLGAPRRLWDIARRTLLQYFDDPLIKRFQNEFFWSQTGSIDEFAQERGKPFEKIARVALAVIFLQCEQSAYLDGNWYRLLRRTLLYKGPQKIPGDRVQIITFNYDRSLEYYLWKATQYTYGLPEGTALSASNALPVHHVYGSLGSLRVGSTTANPVPWGNSGDAEIETAADSLHLIQPLRKGLPAKVATFLRESEFVCFLGFGFWPENFALIEKSVSDAASVFASDRGLAPVLKDQVTARFPKIKWGTGWTAEDCMQAWNLIPI
jgi:hypothetical protein